MTRKLFKALKKQKEATEQVALQIYGTLGIPLGGQKLVEVPNRNAFVFVKLRDNQNEVIQAYNNQVATSYGLPVKVQRQGNRYIVLGVDTERYQNMWNSNSPFLPKHGGSHSFNLGGGGGGDVTWVYSQQMMPLLVYPTSTTGAWNANIAPHTLLDTAGRWRSVGNTGTISFQPFIPTGSSAVMGLIYLDATNGNPGVLIASGSYFPNTITGSLDIYAYIPTPNIATQIPLTAVRLDTGTYNIGWENLYDVRQWVSAVPTGTSSSSASSGTVINIWDEGILKGVADTLNVVGSNADISVSGTVARLFVTGTAPGVDQIGIYGQAVGVPLGTGTVLNVGSGLAFTLSGTVLNLNISDSDPFIPSSGWIPGTGTWTCFTTDSPIFNVAVNTNITGTIGIGDRIQVTQSGSNKFLLVHGVSITGSNSYLNLYGGTDYVLVSGSLTSPQYSQIKAPFGFPLNPDKWTVGLVNSTSSVSQASPVANTWYNLGSLSGTLPIGVWDVSYYVAGVAEGNASANSSGFRVSLSTSGSAQSNADYTSAFVLTGLTVGTSPAHRESFVKSFIIESSVKTPYYLIAMTDVSNQGSIRFRGDFATTIVDAVSVYI